MVEILEPYANQYISMLYINTEIMVHIDGHILKVEKAQESFFQKQKVIDNEYISKSKTYLKNFAFKYKAFSLVLEQLHGFRNAKDYVKMNFDVNEQNILTADLLNQSILAEAFFVQCRSFLDFYARYLLYFCMKKEIKDRGFSVNKVLTLFKKNGNRKAKNVYSYLTNNVLTHYESDNQSTNLEVKTDDKKLWGDLLSDYRNDSTHEVPLILDQINYVSNFGFERVEPGLRNTQIARYLEDKFYSKTFTMLRDLHPILYRVEWGTGVYKEGMYD